jgi:hypothetical protein
MKRARRGTGSQSGTEGTRRRPREAAPHARIGSGEITGTYPRPRFRTGAFLFRWVGKFDNFGSGYIVAVGF